MSKLLPGCGVRDPHDTQYEWYTFDGELIYKHEYGSGWIYYRGESARTLLPETPERIVLWVALKLNGDE